MKNLLERRYVPVRRKGGLKKAVWMTYRARKAVINKRKVFAKHKNSEHPRCVEANKKLRRQQKRLEVPSTAMKRNWQIMSSMMQSPSTRT